jgi:hypothetical protein
MADNYVVLISGLDALDEFDELDAKTIESARLAVNDTTRRARTMAADLIGQQLGFPTGYLSPSGGRLTIKKFATGDDLEGIITARARATSLARFTRGGAVGRPPKGAPLGVNLAVHPGLAKFMKGAFLIHLPSGSDTETLGNLGLAIRLRGRPVRNKKIHVREIDKGLFVLYGPSVSQALGGERGVAAELSPELSEYLLKEFLRQQERKAK